MAEIQKNTASQGEMSRRFVEFVIMQSQNVLFLLGHLQGPEGRAMEPNFDAARMLIDQLEMIEDKTKGNLSADETKILANSLSQLRLAFVETMNESGTNKGVIASEPEKTEASKIISSEPPVRASDSAKDEGEDKVRFKKSYG